MALLLHSLPGVHGVCAIGSQIPNGHLIQAGVALAVVAGLGRGVAAERAGDGMRCGAWAVPGRTQGWRLHSGRAAEGLRPPDNVSLLAVGGLAGCTWLLPLPFLDT